MNNTELDELLLIVSRIEFELSMRIGFQSDNMNVARKLLDKLGAYKVQGDKRE